MGTTRYRAPDPSLFTQGTWTSIQLAALAARPDADPYVQIGVDTAATARELHEATAALGEAMVKRLVADAWLAARHRRARRLVDDAHRWEMWLRGVWRDARDAGVYLTLKLERLRRPYSVGRLIARLDGLMPDLVRQRAAFELRAPPHLLDRGPTYLAALRAEDVRLRELTDERDAAVRAQVAARKTLIACFRRHDRQVRSVVRLTGRVPIGAARPWLPPG